LFAARSVPFIDEGRKTAMNRIHELLDRWTAETPDKIATVDHDGRKLSYQSLGEAVDEAVCYLDAADVRPGDRMMLVAENATAFIAFDVFRLTTIFRI
jgi:non-ribosomal peptide synthetase component E (peptide arylation enzyme)